MTDRRRRSYPLHHRTLRLLRSPHTLGRGPSGWLPASIARGLQQNKKYKLDLIFARYRRFLRQPHVKLLLVMGLVMRLPMSTVGFAMLMHVRALSDSFSVAGAAVGAYLAASAITAPMIGRFIDRYGPRPALLVTGAVCPLALLAIMGAGWLHLSGLAVIAVAAL